MSMRMEALLGVPVIPISAAKNEGVDELVKACAYILRSIRKRPLTAVISVTKRIMNGSGAPLYSRG